jgi:transcriptional regulator MraZ
VDLFLSTYVQKVDRKGRVSVPATFRSSLARQEDPNAIVVFPSMKFAALDAGGVDRITDMKDRLEELEQFSEEYENLTMLFADAFHLTIDGEGRVIIPDILKQYAGIGEEAAFVGLGAAFQIWEPNRFADHRATIRERASRQHTTLPPTGARRRLQ